MTSPDNDDMTSWDDYFSMDTDMFAISRNLSVFEQLPEVFLSALLVANLNEVQFTCWSTHVDNSSQYTWHIVEHWLHPFKTGEMSTISWRFRISFPQCVLPYRHPPKLPHSLKTPKLQYNWEGGRTALVFLTATKTSGSLTIPRSVDIIVQSID